MQSPVEIPAVGYVLKTFPRFSETFVLNEIVARQQGGERVEVASLRPPRDGRFHAKLAQVQAPVRWISHNARSTERLWEALARGRSDVPGFDAALPALLESDPEVAIQALEVALWARERQVDHLHAHFATLATTVARLASRLADIPYSFTAHAKDIFHADVDERALAGAISEAHHVVTVSDYNVADLRRRFPDTSTRIERVYNGLDLCDLTVDRRAPSTPSILSVGRLVEKKGYSTLIDALSILSDRGHPVRARIAGDGTMRDMLSTQIELSGLASSVEMLGPRTQDEVHELMAQATVFVAPCVTAMDGDRDGLPTVLLEAMALGTSVISTTVTGIPEAVIDGETGRLVPERDPYALADALTTMLSDHEDRLRMAANARRLVEQRFDVHAQAAALAELRRGRVLTGAAT